MAPRFSGDGAVLSTDVAQMRRFATALDLPDPGVNEGQRADCAPRGTGGDGVINSGDVIQSRRYATGLDPLSPAGGPTAPSLVPEAISALIDDVYSFFFGREIRVGAVNAESGSTITVPIELTPNGDELGIGFTLEYDAMKLSSPRVTLGEAAPESAILTVNSEQKGRLGILIDSTDAPMAAATPKQLVMVTFDVAPETRGESMLILTSGLASKGVSDPEGRSLAARWLSGSVVIVDPTR